MHSLQILGIGVLLAGLWQAPAVYAEQKMEQEKPTGNFLSLFERKFERRHEDDIPDQHREDAISQYIKACCADRNAAVELLRENGFELRIATDADEVKGFNEGYEQSKQSWKAKNPDYQYEYYDEFISGTRGPTWRRFWKFLNTKYRVSLFIKDGQVAWVTGRVDTTMP